MPQPLSESEFQEIYTRIVGDVYDPTRDDELIGDIPQVEKDRYRLLVELMRIRPKWTSVKLGTQPAGKNLRLAGISDENHNPEFIARGRYNKRYGIWIDANTNEPFPENTTITHWYDELDPPACIGQPDPESL
jgi:hypothetical protein